MGTVRDFKRLVLRLARARHSALFAQRSDAHFVFWEKLNRLGARNMQTQPPETVPDIDATVILSDEEWHELLQELYRVERGISETSI
jgi:hypothetical protein